jgi:hypothetical protein
MTTRVLLARCALAALCALTVVTIAPAAAGAATVQAELRVLTPTRVLDPGTTYVVGAESVATDPNADCNFGGAGGSGDTYGFAEPTALGLLAAAAEADPGLRPLSVTDEFGFGLAICAIGGVDDQPGTFWYLKRNHQELTVGADQEPIADGDEFLVFLAPDNFPEPNPDELELVAPARATPGAPFSVSVIEHGCATDPNTFEVSCQSAPAAGVTVAGGGIEATTGADGTAQLTADSSGRLKLAATREADIAAGALRVCVKEDLDLCPKRHGERIVGSADGERIKGTKGPDVIRGRGGADRIDVRRGEMDKVDCGPGDDRVLVKRGDQDADRLAGDCERTRRR